jgi:hypothetical protein
MDEQYKDLPPINGISVKYCATSEPGYYRFVIGEGLQEEGAVKDANLIAQHLIQAVTTGDYVSSTPDGMPAHAEDNTGVHFSLINEEPHDIERDIAEAVPLAIESANKYRDARVARWSERIPGTRFGTAGVAR